MTGSGIASPLPPEEAALVRAAAEGVRVVLAQGAGTLAALVAATPGRHVIVVESDRAVALALQRQIDAAGLPSAVVVLHHAATGDAARPYPLAVWAEPFFRDPDLILIDGPLATACFVAAALRLRRPATVLVDDWRDRADYRVIAQIATPVRIAGRMAEFRLEPLDAATRADPGLQDLLVDLCTTPAAPRSGGAAAVWPGPTATASISRPSPEAFAQGLVGLFKPGWEGHARAFFAAQADRATLVAAPGFDDLLRQAEQAQGTPLGFARLRLDSTGRSRIATLAAAGRLIVVADPEDESAALATLQAALPQARLCGFARDLVPALIARRGAAVFDPAPALPDPLTLTLVLATPRSGSSLLTDILTDIGAGAVMEHLRLEVLGLMRTDYVFDLGVALRRFLALTQVNGFAGTKIIAHFAADYLTNRNRFGTVLAALEGVRLRPVFIDRRDRVDQAVSGWLARQRGLWHVTTAAEAARIRAAPDPLYDFDEILSWHVDYRHQATFLDMLRTDLPQALSLTYEDDLRGADLAALARRLASFAGLPDQPEGRPFALTRAGKRQQIADAGNARLAARFRVDYLRLFGRTP